MASITPPMSISPDGELLAISSLDGQLSLWDMEGDESWAQYTPSAHLSATCVRLAWPPTPTQASAKQRKSPTKRQKLDSSGDVQHFVAKLGLLAIGTEAGTVLLYSCKQKKLWRELSANDLGGHTGRVNDIAWLAARDSLFTAGEDKFVIEWRISEEGIKCKHQLDRQAVSAVVALDERNLLTASSLIKWWHWPNKQLLKTFNGHSSEVQTLWPIMFEDCTRVPKLPTHNKVNGGLNGNGTVLMNGDEKMHIDDEEEEPQDENKLSSFYFLSAAKSDRYICAWDLGAENSNSIANFSMDEDPRSIQLAYTSSTQTCYILAISRSGTLFIFEYLFGKVNGLFGSIKAAGSVVPRARIELMLQPKPKQSKKNKGSTKMARSFPFLGAYMSIDELSSEVADQDQLQVMLVYGQQERPTFERSSYDKLLKINDEANGQMVIDDVSKLKASAKLSLVDSGAKNQKIQRMSVAKQAEETTVIGPASMMPGLVMFNGGKKDAEVEMEVGEEDDNNNNIDKSPSKKKRKLSESSAKKNEQEKGEMTFEERLKQMTTDDVETTKKETTKKSSGRTTESSSTGAGTDSLVSVLVQGLASDDRQMLKMVLIDTKDEKVMINTARKLPVESVTKLLNELQTGLYRPGRHHMRYLKWIELVMKNKLSYLMTLPGLKKEFLSLSQLLKSRTAILEQCYQLKGKLDIILEHAQTAQKHEMLIYQKPAVTYESESSSDEDDDDDEEDEEMEDDNSLDDYDLMMGDDDQEDEKDDGDEEEEEDDDEEDEEDENEDDEGNETSDRANDSIGFDADNDDEEDEDSDDEE